jgi:ubiquitin-conjugating enzyme E2 Z
MAPTPIALRRIMRDVNIVTGVSSQNLASSGIYYIADDDNITYGTALLIGLKDTPYFGGYYFFSIHFPDDYPFSPIKVQSLTQDGTTRFNPNMYTNGKVCLSILNTWHDGPQWSGVQTLESVLRIIMSDVLHDNPIINEPAYRSYKVTHPDAISYNRLLWHANLHTAICKQLENPPKWAIPFQEVMIREFQKNRNVLIQMAEASTTDDNTIETTRVYQMRIKYEFYKAVEKLKSIKN